MGQGKKKANESRQLTLKLLQLNPIRKWKISLIRGLREQGYFHLPASRLWSRADFRSIDSRTLPAYSTDILSSPSANVSWVKKA